MRQRFHNFWIDPEFKRKRAFLQRIAFFQDISRRDFGRLFQSMTQQHYLPGDVLFEEGDIGRALFIVESGAVQIKRKEESGQVCTVAVMSSGDCFGEMSLLDDYPRTASAIALEPTDVYLLYKTKLEELVESHPAVGLAIMRHLAQVLAIRLRHAMQPGKLPKAA